MFDPRTEAWPCPKCSAVLDAACQPGGGHARPAPGDVTVCAYCATALQYDDALQPQLLTEEVRATIEPETAYLLRVTQEHFQRMAEARKGLQ